MKPITVLYRPETLEIDKEYIWRRRLYDGEVPAHIPVKFVDYDACPAMVVVSGRDGKYVRVPRDELFACEVTDMF